MHASDEMVQCSGLMVLQCLSQNQPANQALIIANEGVGIVDAALAAHLDNNSVQETGLALLDVLTTYMEQVRRQRELHPTLTFVCIIAISTHCNPPTNL